VLVAFYVDEQGNVRLPNVESEASPAVVSQVMKAVLAWKFSPPMIKGKAVLAYANRTLTFTKKTSVSPSGVEASGDVHQK
jgi:TonB family protein